MRFRVVDEQGRIRRHMGIFVAGDRVVEIKTHLTPQDEMHILGALSGG